MATTKRDIGKEILEGIRQIKRGEIGRRTTVPPSLAVKNLVGGDADKRSEGSGPTSLPAAAAFAGKRPATLPEELGALQGATRLPEW